MRGVETRIQEIRHRVFREVARMAYHTEWPVDKRIEIGRASCRERVCQYV